MKHYEIRIEIEAHTDYEAVGLADDLAANLRRGSVRRVQVFADVDWDPKRIHDEDPDAAAPT